MNCLPQTIAQELIALHNAAYWDGYENGEMRIIRELRDVPLTIQAIQKRMDELEHENKIRLRGLIKQDNKGENSMSIENDLKRIADALEHQCRQVAWIHNLPNDLTGPPAEAVSTVDPLEVPPAKPKREKPAPAPAAEAQPAAPTEKISEQTLREELRQYIVREEAKGKGKGMEAAAALLKKYDAKTVGSIKPENYAPIVKFCRDDKEKAAVTNGKK